MSFSSTPPSYFIKELFRNDAFRLFMAGIGFSLVLWGFFQIPLVRGYWEQPSNISIFMLLIIGTYIITVTSIIVANFYVKKLNHLRAYSDRDELTGLYQRSQFERALTYECNRSIRYKQPLSLLLLSIDSFDEMSSQLGLHGAKLVIQHVGKMVQEQIRNTDLGFIYKDNSSFALLLPSTTGKSALLAAQRVRDITSSRGFRNPETGEMITITLSAAIKQLDHEGIANSNDPKEIIIKKFHRRADLMLNQATEKGNKCLLEIPTVDTEEELAPA